MSDRSFRAILLVGVSVYVSNPLEPQPPQTVGEFLFRLANLAVAFSMAWVVVGQEGGEA